MCENRADIESPWYCRTGKYYKKNLKGTYWRRNFIKDRRLYSVMLYRDDKWDAREERKPRSAKQPPGRW